jgi:Fe-S cluster biogenesis protein NfuA
MTLTERIAEAVEKLKPKLEHLAEGHVEFVGVDEERGQVRVKLIGGMVC